MDPIYKLLSVLNLNHFAVAHHKGRFTSVKIGLDSTYNKYESSPSRSLLVIHYKDSALVDSLFITELWQPSSCYYPTRRVGALNAAGFRKYRCNKSWKLFRVPLSDADKVLDFIKLNSKVALAEEFDHLTNQFPEGYFI